MKIPGVIVSGFRRHLFSSKEAAKVVDTVSDKDHPRLLMGKPVPPLQQAWEDQELYSFHTDLNTDVACDTMTAMRAQAAQTSGIGEWAISTPKASIFSIMPEEMAWISSLACRRAKYAR